LPRRTLIGAAAAAPFILSGCGDGAPTAAASCFDYDSMSATEQSLRRTLNFRERYDDPNKQCGGCEFFTAGEGPCGTCRLLNNGAVSPQSVCGSWAAKLKQEGAEAPPPQEG
jgi:hypothetical protein